MKWFTLASLPFWAAQYPLLQRMGCAAILATFTASSGHSQSAQENLGVAAFGTAGELQRPANLDRWVFLGTSVGMGYNQQAFDADSPGQFNVVLMEPRAYEYFKANGKYADGTMFLLSFYQTDQQLSIARSGFVQGDLDSFEIHLIDRQRTDSRVFYPFSPKDTQAKALPAGNECVRCHLKDGAFDGTFAQFYPAIRQDIPKAALEKALKKK